LSQIARQIYEVAEAIVFWMERQEIASPVDGSELQIATGA
jgi:hypothetical protein